MFRWHYSEAFYTNASPQQVWSIWTDVHNWPAWDTELEWAKIKDAFVVGATGTMKPRGAPVVKFVLTHVEENRQFIDLAKLPLTRIEFIHRYEIFPEGRSRIVHEIEMNGFLAPLFGRLIGNKIRQHLPDAMEKLSNIAEASQQVQRMS